MSPTFHSLGGQLEQPLGQFCVSFSAERREKPGKNKAKRGKKLWRRDLGAEKWETVGKREKSGWKGKFSQGLPDWL